MIVTTLIFGIVKQLGEIDGVIGGIIGGLDAFASAGEGGVGIVPPFDGGAEVSFVAAVVAAEKGGGGADDEEDW